MTDVEFEAHRWQYEHALVGPGASIMQRYLLYQMQFVFAGPDTVKPRPIGQFSPEFRMLLPHLVPEELEDADFGDLSEDYDRSVSMADFRRSMSDQGQVTDQSSSTSQEADASLDC